MTTDQPLTLSFLCGQCDARLTVKSVLAGRKINCPKCHKKVVVPKENDGVAEQPDNLSAPATDTSAKNTASPQAAVPESPRPQAAAPAKPVEDKPASATPPAAPAPERPAVAPAAMEAAKARAEAAEREAQAREAALAQRDQELEKLQADLADRQRRETELNAELQKLRIDEQAAREQLQTHAAQSDDARQTAQALETSRRTISQLEQKLEAQRRAGSAPANKPAPVVAPSSKATPEDDEGTDPDQLIAGLQNSTLRRGLRISLAGHAILLLLTSLGLFYAWIVRDDTPEPEPVVQTQEQSARPASTVAREEAAMALDRPEDRSGVAPVRERPAQPRSSIEEAVESLPEPGQVPQPSDVSLDLDF